MSPRHRPVRFTASLASALVATVALAGAVFVAPVAAAADDLAAVTVTGAPDEKPTVTIASPVSVKSTTTKVLYEGTGDKTAKNAVVNLDFTFVNARTGAELQTSYGQGSVPMTLDRTQVQPVIVDNLLGKRVGSRVMIAIAPKEGLAKAFASDSIKKNDTLLFIVDLHSSRVPLKRATGTTVTPAAGLPTVKLAKNGAPTITPVATSPPASLVVQPLIKGTGPVVESGQTITVHYTGALWDGGRVFDSSWKSGSTLPTEIGTGSVIKGWDEGLVGQTVGSQVLLVVPPEYGYGSSGQSSAGIKGTDTLVFVVDILDAS